MAQVPRSYPPERGRDRCGDSYAANIEVDGRIPNTGFGGQYTETIEAVRFGGHTLPSSWPEIGVNGHEFAETRDAIRDRLETAAAQLELNAHLPEVARNRRTLERILERAEDELEAAEDAFDNYSPAVPPAQGEPIWYPESVQRTAIDRVTDALKWLRCAQYWTARLKLYQQALDEYEPPPKPLGFTARPQVGQPTITLPDPDEEPPDAGAQPDASAPAASKVNPWTVSAVALAVGSAWDLSRGKSSWGVAGLVAALPLLMYGMNR